MALSLNVSKKPRSLANGAPKFLIMKLCFLNGRPIVSERAAFRTPPWPVKKSMFPIRSRKCASSTLSNKTFVTCEFASARKGSVAGKKPFGGQPGSLLSGGKLDIGPFCRRSRRS